VSSKRFESSEIVTVIQASAWYPPKHTGGTEIYLTGLVRELRALGFSSRVVTPREAGEADKCEFDGAAVRTFPVRPLHWRAELYRKADREALDEFRRVIIDQGAEIYHQHSWDMALGAAHLRAAHEAGLKTVLTVHTPWNFCSRGTMVRFGREECDGRIDPLVCATCWMQKHGMPATIGRRLAAIPPAASAALGRAMPEKHLASAFFARALGERRKHEFAEMVADADRLVAVCSWLLDALRLNGVPMKKLLLSRYGVDSAFADEAATALKPAGCDAEQPFRLLYLGRWDPTKGVHVLVEAVEALPTEIEVQLIIHGIGEGTKQRNYASAVHRLAAGSPRIKFEPPVPRSRLVATLSQASAVAIPSLWLETGPLVALEAKAAGLPVIGSRLGGIPELIHEPEDGVLVPPGDARAWTEAIRLLAINRAQKRAPRARDKVRTMRDVAKDMAALYESLN
jgi:glycosyltransferase involved in cell wall biosynthesis